MGINVWAAFILGAAALLGVVDYARTKHLTDLAVALLAVGVAAAFFFAGNEPLLHP